MWAPPVAVPRDALTFEGVNLRTGAGADQTVTLALDAEKKEFRFKLPTGERGASPPPRISVSMLMALLSARNFPLCRRERLRSSDPNFISSSPPLSRALTLPQVLPFANVAHVLRGGGHHYDGVLYIKTIEPIDLGAASVTQIVLADFP